MLRGSKFRMDRRNREGISCSRLNHQAHSTLNCTALELLEVRRKRSQLGSACRLRLLPERSIRWNKGSEILELKDIGSQQGIGCKLFGLCKRTVPYLCLNKE